MEAFLSRAAHLLCFAEFLNNLCSHVKVLEQVISHCVSDPGSSLGWTELQQLVPSLLERERGIMSTTVRVYNPTFRVLTLKRKLTHEISLPVSAFYGIFWFAVSFVIPHPVSFQVSHLDLQQGEVSENLQIVLIPLQSVTVTLDGLVILFIWALQQAVHVPAWCGQSVRENHAWTQVSTRDTSSRETSSRHFSEWIQQLLFSWTEAGALKGYRRGSWGRCAGLVSPARTPPPSCPDSWELNPSWPASLQQEGDAVRESWQDVTHFSTLKCAESNLAAFMFKNIAHYIFTEFCQTAKLQQLKKNMH